MTLRGFARGSAEDEVDAAVQKFLATANSVRVGAVGTRLLVELDLTGNALAGVENMTIGANLTTHLAEGSLISWSLRGMERKTIATEPEVYFQSVSGGPAIFLAQSYGLTLTHKSGTFAGRSGWDYIEIDVTS